MSQAGYAPGHGPKRRKELEAGGGGGGRGRKGNLARRKRKRLLRRELRNHALDSGFAVCSVIDQLFFLGIISLLSCFCFC